MNAIRQAIAGKKTYLLAIAALIGTAVAWSEGAISNIDALIALYASLQAICIRLGIAKTATNAVETAVRVVEADKKIEQVEDAYEVEAKAHARLMNAEAVEKERENCAKTPD